MTELCTIKTPLQLVVGYLENTLTPSNKLKPDKVLYKDIDNRWEFPYHPEFGWIVLWDDLEEFLEIYWYKFYIKEIIPQLEEIDPELPNYVHQWSYIEEVLKPRENKCVYISCETLRAWVKNKCMTLLISNKDKEELIDKLIALAIEANDTFVYEEV